MQDFYSVLLSAKMLFNLNVFHELFFFFKYEFLN